MLVTKLPRGGFLKKTAFNNMKNKVRTFCAPPVIKESKIEVNGHMINYIKTGSGSHPVLLFPGAVGTIWTDFAPQIKGLDQRKFRVVAWDPPGYGHSRPPDRVFGPDFYERDAEMAVALMDKLELPRFSVLGWSDGGISAMIMAARYPEEIRKLVIWGANAFVMEKEIKIYESIRNIDSWSDKLKGPLIKIYGRCELQRMWDEWCNSLHEIYLKCDGNICKDLLSSIQCPTFILHGDKDPMIAEEHPGYLSVNILPSRLYRFPKGKHNIHLRYADEFNELVSDFLQTYHTMK